MINVWEEADFVEIFTRSSSAHTRELWGESMSHAFTRVLEFPPDWSREAKWNVSNFCFIITIEITLKLVLKLEIPL